MLVCDDTPPIGFDGGGGASLTLVSPSRLTKARICCLLNDMIVATMCEGLFIIADEDVEVEVSLFASDFGITSVFLLSF